MITLAKTAAHFRGERASAGLDITADCYPYDAWSPIVPQTLVFRVSSVREVSSAAVHIEPGGTPALASKSQKQVEGPNRNSTTTLGSCEKPKEPLKGELTKVAALAIAGDKILKRPRRDPIVVADEKK